MKQFKDEFDSFEIVVGSSEKTRTKRNPLNFKERKDIIQACHPDVKVIPLEDEDRGEEGYRDWTQRLMEKTEANIVISRNELVQRLVREYSESEIVEQELYRPEECSGTEIRKSIREGSEWRHLVPDCCQEKIEEVKDVIAETR